MNVTSIYAVVGYRAHPTEEDPIVYYGYAATEAAAERFRDVLIDEQSRQPEYARDYQQIEVEELPHWSSAQVAASV